MGRPDGMSDRSYVSAGFLLGVWHGYAGFWGRGSRDSSKRALDVCCEAGVLGCVEIGHDQGLILQRESLILAQNERWRQA